MPTPSATAGAISIDGRLLAPDEARISPLDHGFLYGDGLFETMRTFGGVLFRVDEHLDRLERGIEELAIAGVPPRETLRGWIEAAVRRAALPEAYCRITVTRGRSTRGFDPLGCSSASVIVSVLPLRTRPAASYVNGIRATFLWSRARDDRPPPWIKSTSYQRSVIARLELGRRGADEGFFLDERLNVTEGTTCNVFARMSDALVTPPAYVCLPGITRREVLSIAVELGLTTREDEISRERLLTAEEVFVTSSLAGLLPVTHIDSTVIGDGRPGELYRRLASAYDGRTSSRLT